MTSDATLWRRICAVRSPYVRADWYKGMRFEPDKDVILTYRDEKHMEMRSKLAAGVSLKTIWVFVKLTMDHSMRAEKVRILRRPWIRA